MKLTGRKIIIWGIALLSFILLIGFEKSVKAGYEFRDVHVVIPQNTSPADTLGTGFTYQGQIYKEGNPVNEDCDLQFSLWDAESAGHQSGDTLTVLGLIINDGLFTTVLDFGAGMFNGNSRWLEITARCPAGRGEYTTLGRQELTPVPNAIYAANAGSLDGRDGSFYQVRVDGECAAGSAIRIINPDGTVTCETSANQPPVAILQANPAVLYLGETGTKNITFNLSQSYDPEGSSLTYSFDPIGRNLGLPDTYTTVSFLGYQFSNTGDYLAAGWVQDDGGAVDRAETLVRVFRFGSTIVNKGETEQVGAWASMAMVAGRPAIAYTRGSYSDEIWFSRALDASGTAWDVPIKISTDGYTYDYLSLAVVDGNPAVALRGHDLKVGNYWLEFIRAEDPAGLLWGSSVSIECCGNGAFASLAVVAGNPAIAYYDSPNNSLKYVRAIDAQGTAWGNPVVVKTGGGEYADLDVVGGTPAIAFYNNTSEDLQYVKALDSTGSSWGNPVTLDSAGDVGRFASLAIVEGNPAVAYKDQTNGDLKFVRVSGDSWGTPVVVESTNNVGEYASLAVINGIPAIAYLDLSEMDLMFKMASNTSGTTWSSIPTTVESSGHAGFFASLVEVDGRPGIAYANSVTGYLYFSIPRQD